MGTLLTTWCLPWQSVGADPPLGSEPWSAVEPDSVVTRSELSRPAPSPGIEPGIGLRAGPPIQLISPPSTPAEIRPVAAGGMLGFSSADATGKQTITLVDTGKSWMSVYHVDSGGTIRLVSSRPIDADFSLQLNAKEPLPEDIRRLKNAR